MEVVRPVTYRAALGFAHVTTNWASAYADGGGTANDYIDITDSPEWTQYTAVFNDYKVTYCKMKLMMPEVDAGGNELAIFDITT